MGTTSPTSVTESGAFVEAFALEPTGHGALDGLCFAVKDLIDVAGHKTGCGNPTWHDTHPPAIIHAVCVEQLLGAGGRGVGKTVTDELAFSLLGENHFYGTPLNGHAPDRVPGGSSSGSASAVACGLADFALGTDTGGSVRVPASNCGIWGLRPSHGFISVAGVNPFAPTFDTVGILARSADVLARSAMVLLACDSPQDVEAGQIHLVPEAFALADPDVQQALAAPLERLSDQFCGRVRETSLNEIMGEPQETAFPSCYDTYCVLQWAEIESTLRAWMAATQPVFGPATAANFALTLGLDRRRISAAARQREKIFRRLQAFLGPSDLLCMPTTPALAPLKGSLLQRGQGSDTYYTRALSLTSIAGLGRLPQVSMPLGEHAGVPAGLSVLAAHGRDALLLAIARKVGAAAGR
jgi:amidase